MFRKPVFRLAVVLALAAAYVLNGLPDRSSSSILEPRVARAAASRQRALRHKPDRRRRYVCQSSRAQHQLRQQPAAAGRTQRRQRAARAAGVHPGPRAAAGRGDHQGRARAHRFRRAGAGVVQPRAARDRRAMGRAQAGVERSAGAGNALRRGDPLPRHPDAARGCDAHRDALARRHRAELWPGAAARRRRARDHASAAAIQPRAGRRLRRRSWSSAARCPRFRPASTTRRATRFSRPAWHGCGRRRRARHSCG